MAEIDDDLSGTAIAVHDAMGRVQKYAIVRNAETDVIAERFEIKTELPLPKKNTEFAEAYVVEDRKQQDQKHYALVYNNGVSVRLSVILALKDNAFPHFHAPIAAEVTWVSVTGQQHVVAIFQEPEGVTFEEYLEEHGPCSEGFIQERVVAPILNLLNALHGLEIVHGAINAKNIYIHEGEIIVGDCVSALCGYHQPLLYEPLERGLSDPVGKGSGDQSVDYYALGVLATHLFLGRSPMPKGVDDAGLLQMKLQKGSFNAVAGDVPMPVIMTDLLRGLLNDRKDERWYSRQVKDWIKGRRYNLISPTDHIESSRPLVFNDVLYMNRRMLAHDLHQDRDAAKKFLKEDKLIKWVDRSVGDPDMAEHIKTIMAMAMATNRGRMSIDDDEMVSRIIMILDPSGPVRLGDVASNVDGIIPMLAYGYAKGKSEYLQYVTKVLRSHLVEAWSESIPDVKNHPNYNSIWLLERTQSLVDEAAFGFGLERCLYELNPSLPCQSPILKGEYITSLNELLWALDEQAKEIDGDIMDRQIAAFTSCRLDLQSEVRVRTLSRYAKFESHKLMRILTYVALAQKETKIKHLRKLCSRMGDDLQELLALLNGKQVREELEEKLLKAVQGGDLMVIFRLMSDPTFIKRDIRGFQEAAQHYAILEQQAALYDNKKAIASMGFRYGLQMSVVLSYLICSIVLIIVMVRVV